MDFGKNLTEKQNNNFITAETLKTEFTASNVNTTGEANDDIFPTIVVDIDGNIIYGVY